MPPCHRATPTTTDYRKVLMKNSKRKTTQSSYPCPRCGGALTKDGHTPTGKQRWSCRTRVDANERGSYCYRTTSPESPVPINKHGRPEGPPQVFKRKLKPVKRYLITAAQNATPLHDGFWKALVRASAHYEAELLAIPLRYRNPTSRYETKQAETDEWWDPQVVPYLWNTRKALNENVEILGDVKIQPTAIEPLTGLEGFTGARSSIVGHTKLQFKTVPTPGHKMAKIMTTTGACTKKNYSDSRAGKHGEFHHTLGAVIVEIRGKQFWLRHLNANQDGSFTDLDMRFEVNRTVKASPPEAIILGDTHVDFTDNLVDRATFGPGGIVQLLAPKKIVWHDLLDAYSCNPHHRGNPFNAIAKLHSGLDDVAAEVRRAIDFVVKRTGNAESFVVSSNHDDFVYRWILNHDWKLDAKNAVFYLETALAIAKQTKMGSGGTECPRPFKYWIDAAGHKNITALTGGESLNIAGVECGMHGDVGPNGARGSIKNLRRIGIKSFIGHAHSPGINEGAYQVGTSSRLKLEYNKGPSGWLNCHGLIHADGKRQLVTIIEGKWRL